MRYREALWGFSIKQNSEYEFVKLLFRLISKSLSHLHWAPETLSWGADCEISNIFSQFSFLNYFVSPAPSKINELKKTKTVRKSGLSLSSWPVSYEEIIVYHVWTNWGVESGDQLPPNCFSACVTAKDICARCLTACFDLLLISH